jgi:hypothetical protein
MPYNFAANIQSIHATNSIKITHSLGRKEAPADGTMSQNQGKPKL